jgi:UDP-2-acetamido-2-deoxy-ribo-hexuluronate aminotransferase
MKYVDLQSQFTAYEPEIRREIEEVLRGAQFILGPKGKELERKLAAYAGVTHAIACSSGTDALLLALMAHGVKAGDEIVTSPFTFIATAEMIVLVGATPVFVDIDPMTYNIATARIEEAITKNTRGIIAVSLYGQCPEMEAILSVAGEYGLFVIEDGAQSFGADRNGRRSCGWPHVGATSFFPFTSDDGLAERIRGLGNHGQWEKYQHRVIGINGRLDELQAAVLLGKFPRFPDEVGARAYMGARYSDRLGDIVGVPAVSPGNTHVYAQYTIRTPKRDDLVAHLRENGIPTAVHYPIPLHLQEAFRGLGYEKGDFPESEAAASEVVSLPMSAFLSEADQDEVIRQVRRFFGK